MADGVEGVHAGQPVGQCAGHGQGEVDDPQHARGFRDARGQLLVLGHPGGLRTIQLHAADTQQGQDGDGQHDDAHATEELDLLAMIEDGFRQLVEPGDDGGTGGGEAGDRFEQGVGDPEVQADNEGQRTDHAEDHPEQGDDEEAVAHGQFTVFAQVRQPQQQSRHRRDQQGGGEHHHLPVVVDEGNDHGGQEAETVQHQQDTEQPGDCAPVHAGSCGMAGSRMRTRVLLREDGTGGYYRGTIRGTPQRRLRLRTCDSHRNGTRLC